MPDSEGDAMTTKDVETTGAAVAPAWVPRTVESAAGLDLVPPPLPPGEAPAWCNFVGFTPGAVPVDDTTVAWFGTDCLGHRAASVRAARTTIEISVLDGEFTDDELLALVRSLQPVSAEAALALSATPFADLSYWARYDAS